MLKDRQKLKISTDKKPTAHSSTFGCPTARATASQPKELEFCRHTTLLILKKIVRNKKK